MLDEAPMFGSHDDGALKREVEGWKDDRLFAEAGQVYSYSNPGYWLAGLLAETTGGKPYADQVATSIFAPIGMTRSTFRPTVAMTFPLAQGHALVGGTPQIIRPSANNSASWPAGSIYSNVMDLSKWMIAFVNGGMVGGTQVLPANVFKALSTPHATIPGGSNRYGYGVQVGTWRGLPMVEHNGSRSGYGSVMRMVPSKQFGVVVLANRTGASLTRAANTALELAFKLAPGPAPPARSRTPLSAAEVTAYAGVYSQGARKMELVARAGELFLRRAAGDVKVEKVGDLELMAGATRYVAIRHATGRIEFLHTGGRSWRKVQ
jgi:CubicO group peptidase (beta-lactamase class C family)